MEKDNGSILVTINEADERRRKLTSAPIDCSLPLLPETMVEKIEICN